MTFFLKGTGDDGGADPSLVSSVITLWGKVTEQRSLADFIVCTDICKPGLRNSLAMVLKGGCLMCRSCLHDVSNGLGAGTRLAFKSQLCQLKLTYISDDFTKNFEGIANEIRQAIDGQGTPRQWKLLSSFEDVLV